MVAIVAPFQNVSASRRSKNRIRSHRYGSLMPSRLIPVPIFPNPILEQLDCRERGSVVLGGSSRRNRYSLRDRESLRLSQEGREPSTAEHVTNPEGSAVVLPRRQHGWRARPKRLGP